MAMVNLNGHSLYVGAGRDFNMKNWATNKTSTNQFTDLTISGKVTGEGQLVINNEKTVFLQNTANDYKGGTVIEYGTLSALNTRVLGTGNVTVTDGGVLILNNPSENGGTNNLTVTVENGGAIKPSGALGTVTIDLKTGSVMTASSGISAVNIKGTGTINVPGYFDAGGFNASEFAGTINLEKDRYRVGGANKLGSSEVTVNVKNGAQLWLINSGLVTGTFNLAGMGTANNPDGMGAIRLETTSKIGGQVNLLADACISTFYNQEEGNAKDIQASVNLNDYTLYLGAGPAYDPTTYVWGTGYWFTDVTVSGKVSGNGRLAINNTKTVYLTNTNDYTGKTQVLAGTLALNAENAVAKSGEVVNNTAITFSKNQTLQNLSGEKETATITGANGTTLTLFNSKNTSYAGDLAVKNLVFGNGAADAGVGTLEILGDVSTLENLTLDIGVTESGADKLVLSAFDPTKTELNVSMTLADGMEFASGMEYEILSVKDGALSSAFNWQSVSDALSNLDNWNFYLNENGILMAGVNAAKYPEPSTFVLLVLGVGFMFWRKRKTKQVA
ncbi:MAG: PEP-CTERM sorting domain-containing protein [Planctomycetia bacterium]|nr:PEP-CTERM sorting domain-containing protein [Planctomycetia bacterium]